MQRQFDEVTMRLTFTIEDEDGLEREVALPARFVICERCRGRGAHSHALGAFTGDELAEEGPEFAEDYFRGVYDSVCEECNGRRVVPIVDEGALNPALAEDYERVVEERIADAQFEAQMRREYEAERRFGC